MQGQSLQSHGRFEEAERRFQSALNEANRSHAQPSVQVAALENLASVEIDLVHIDKAVALYHRAISILAQNAGENDVHLRQIRIVVAELYLETGQITTAEKLLNRVIASQNADNTPLTGTAFALEVRACLYSHEKKLDKAEKAVREALSILESLGETEKATFAIGTLHFSSILNLRKRPADALPYAERALTLFRRLSVSQPAMEAAADVTLASIYSRLGLSAQAEAAARDAYVVIEQFYGPDHPKTALILLAKAAVLRTIEKKAAAREAQKEGEKIIAQKSNGGLIYTVPMEALLSK